MSKFTETLKMDIDAGQPGAPTPDSNNPEPTSAKANKFKKWLKKPIVRIIITLLLITGAGATGYNYLAGNKAPTDIAKTVLAKEVKIAVIDLEASNENFINTVGTVKAETQVDVVALTRGTIRSLFFNVGDEVFVNKMLARLQNNTTAVSFANAQTNLANTMSSQDATRRITLETIRQVELGVDTAGKAVDAAAISLKATQDNLNNIDALQEKNNADARDSAIISFYDYLNTINSALDQINFLIKAEEGELQVAGVDETVLGVLNLSTLNQAKTSYLSAQAAYDQLIILNPNRDTINNDLSQAETALSLAKLAVDNTITLLDNTITSASFSEASLTAQKNIFFGLQGGLANTQSGAKRTLQSLQNLDLINKQEQDGLINAAAAAQTQLEQAQVGYDNALVALVAAEQGNKQQLIASQTATDGARGALNVLGTQMADLNIKAPISGTIINKYVEVGAEINPGQKIAQIAQTDMVKIEISLPSEDIYRVQAGQEAIIANKFMGTINTIDPAADPITRKVRVEILYDNSNKDLIPGTFVDISIPIEKLQKTHAEAVFIPLRAVTITQTENYVFTAVNGQAKKIPVKTGKTTGALIEILDGLNNSDELIVEGNKLLKDGEEVKIVNE